MTGFVQMGHIYEPYLYITYEVLKNTMSKIPFCPNMFNIKMWNAYLEILLCSFFSLVVNGL